MPQKKSPQKINKRKQEAKEVAWMCHCGSYQESWDNCSECGSQPPWGCQCSDCDNYYDDDLGFGFSSNFL